MIKNNRQYQAAQEQVEKFRAAIADLEAGKNLKAGTHPRLVQIQIDALASEIQVLEDQMKIMRKYYLAELVKGITPENRHKLDGWE